MVEFITKFGSDPRSLAILAIGIICWLIIRERPSRNAAVALVIFFAAFSLFTIWKYAPSFEKIEPFDLATMTADQLRAHIMLMQRATDVLWRVMEMFVWGVHVTALLYLTGYFLREREVYAKGIIGILWTAEAVSLATDSTWCRFVQETSGSDLIEILMRTGSTPEACEAHWGPAATWTQQTVWAFVLLYAFWVYARAKRSM